MAVVAKVKCVACKATREIDPASIPHDDVPYCDKCYMPMVVVSVTAKASGRAPTNKEE